MIRLRLASTVARSIPALAATLVLVPSAPAQTLTTELVTAGLSRPVYVVSPPGDTQRLFVVEQNTARIRIIENGSILATPFLDVNSEAGQSGEQGLLGLAFHPDYANNGRFFINYTNNQGNTRVVEYVVSADPNVADPNPVQPIQSINQPFTNHNGGCLQFGPDGMLYIGMGDGGSSNDPGNRAQNLGERLGKMLRLDIDLPSPFIPADNPYVGSPNGEREEIWAAGVRNPWRFSFDRLTGDLYIADVGQNAREEIDFQPVTSTGAENYGWRCMEGFNCTGLSGCTCNDASLTLPIYDYGHGGGNCSITGGYVYRGPIAWLDGTYFFADYCSDKIWSFRYDGATISDFTDRTAELAPGGGLDILTISSFGQDELGNLYICDLSGGELFRIVEACAGSGQNYCQTSPNSFGSGALISAGGSYSISDNAWNLSVSGSVPNQFGLFIYGLQATQVPAGNGFLCVGGTAYRVLPPIQGDPNGMASLAVDFTIPPFSSGPGMIVAGQTYYFQWWNRDPAAGGAKYNFSDGFEAVFCP